MVVVTCIKWGTKYPAVYVNRLHAMVTRWLDAPHHFICFTDDTAGINPHIETRPLPDPLQGWWNKMSLFRGDLFTSGSTVLFFDLDVVITGPLDFLLDGDETFKTCAHCGRTAKDGYNSSVMRITAGAHTDIYQRFVDDADGRVASGAIRGDQEFIWSIHKTAALFPKGKVRSFKFEMSSHCYEGRLTRSAKIFRKIGDRLPALPWTTTKLPDEVSVVLFHGKPDPEDVIGRGFGPYKRAPFVAEHWRT